MNLLMNGKYSFPDDNFLLWRKKKKTKFTVSSRKEIIREMKVITIIKTFTWRGSSVGNNSCVKLKQNEIYEPHDRIKTLQTIQFQFSYLIGQILF